MVVKFLESWGVKNLEHQTFQDYLKNYNKKNSKDGDFLILILINNFFNLLKKIGDFLGYLCNFWMVFLKKIEIFFSLKVKSRNRLF